MRTPPKTTMTAWLSVKYDSFLRDLSVDGGVNLVVYVRFLPTRETKTANVIKRTKATTMKIDSIGFLSLNMAGWCRSSTRKIINQIPVESKE